jgi:hypothetical protein
MRTADVVTQLRPRLSLRGRLYLFSGAILILFAINVAVSLWGSFARNESSLAYQEAVTAAQLTAELEQNLQTNDNKCWYWPLCARPRMTRWKTVSLIRHGPTWILLPSVCGS